MSYVNFGKKNEEIDEALKLKRMNVLYLGSGMLGCADFRASLVGFMKKDPTIELSEEEEKILKLSDLMDDYNPDVQKLFSEKLKCPINLGNLNPNEVRRVFDFRLPLEDQLVDVRLDAFSLVEIKNQGLPMKQSLDYMMKSAEYDLKVVCECCLRDTGLYSRREMNILYDRFIDINRCPIFVDNLIPELNKKI